MNDDEKTEERAQSEIREFSDRVAERLGAHATVAAVFGQPIDRGEVTVVPVARVLLRVGAGRNRRGGMSARGGASASPVGYLEIGDGGARFGSIPDLPAIARLIVAYGFATSMILFGIGHVRRGGGRHCGHGHHRWKHRMPA